ncbi:MAG TPA: acyl-CoA dehydrogenase family protein, partial [Puia sp.]
YTVFAKVNGEKFTAFIVEKDFEGFTRGPEEHKMGIKGSSTVQLYFQDCRVPAENVLGEIGRGHVIAFNILNIGRLKLCAAALGAGKRVAGAAIEYANTREQFKTRISQFGAIKNKIAEMAIYIWVAESALYRVSDWIELKKGELLEEGKPVNEAALGAAEEYAIECAMLKVFGSEMLDFVVDEAVQIHGGNGFSDEYPVSRSYRDSRINRIFEGTNEINRLLIVDMVLKRAAKGRLDILSHAKAVAKELMGIPDFASTDDAPFAGERKTIAQFKKAILMTAGAAVQKLNERIENEQEILMHIADMAIVCFHAESALLRVIKRAEGKGESGPGFETDILQTYLYDAADQLNKAGKDAINAFASGDEQRMLLLGLKRYTKTNPVNSKEAKRKIADLLIAANKYPL